MTENVCTDVPTQVCQEVEVPVTSLVPKEVRFYLMFCFVKVVCAFFSAFRILHLFRYRLFILLFSGLRASCSS